VRAEISTAFSVLSDPEKRRNYDQFGHEDGQQAHVQGHGGGGGFAQHMTPNDIFEMFFSDHDEGGFVRMGRNPNVRFYRHGMNGGGGSAASGVPSDFNRGINILQVLPLLLLLIMTLLSFSGSDERVFRWASVACGACQAQWRSVMPMLSLLSCSDRGC
jgi:hypothetical protein